MYKKIAIGLFAGLICGFFSTGGGMILVPGFVYILKIQPTESRATSVCCILPMVIVSSFFYYKNSYIDWKTSILCATGGIIGGILGAKILKDIPDKILKIIFTFFLIYASIKFIL
ncbi:MAG: sulfite exporter TauE/SafE family protein [Clostridia bacterium]|nr:sulfite exporter TauE/SafE family protein [Clostridia bacterium]